MIIRHIFKVFFIFIQMVFFKVKVFVYADGFHRNLRKC